MPRRSKRRNATDIDTQDDLLHEIARPERVHSPPILDRAPRRTTGLADLRRWDPQPNLAREATGRPARIVHKVASPKRLAAGAKALSPNWSPGTRWKPTASFRFETGGKIPICVRRTKRREVLHALRKTKAGKGSPKKRNQWSAIKC